MKSREKLIAALNHQCIGKLAFDLGATKATGINASMLYRLRKAYGRDEPVKIYDVYQMLGMIDEKDMEMFGIDVVGIWSDVTCFGYRNKNWKSWTMPDGTPALVGEGFASTVDSAGTTFIYPQGDLTAKPSGRLPKNGYYFDQIVRQEAFDEDSANAFEDYKEQFVLYDDETLRYYEENTSYYYNNTDYGIVLNAEVSAFGAATQVIGPMLKVSPGIRDLAEWLMAHHLYPDYVKEIFEFQSDMAIKNLQLLKEAVGNKPQAVFLSSTDFGTQAGPIMSVAMFQELYTPYYRKVCNWVHENTTWKTLFHSCGSVSPFMDEMVDFGLDCLNPIQCEAANMDPQALKNKYNKKLVFWGGGVDSQSTIAKGTPDDVEKQMEERIRILGADGGFVFSIGHNIQINDPMDNVRRVFDVLKNYR
ncbi:uroporphyrinogen decarboxylase family protein [Sporomusa aerivorans]|uniref:uroporphyrinogen decarboxylase family protein n=1 Tax=Sporomusa aerivorans TaxID=204936 RepID=UPI00352B77DD